MPPNLIAILRGVTPERIEAVARVLFEEGVRAIEVPLNSPEPFDSIARLSRAFSAECLCGAGTVLDAADVARVKDAGGKLIVTPNTDPAVIAQAVALDMTVVPGFATATEAFAAIKAGARTLKLFPAKTYGSGHLKALKAVLPRDVPVYAVGGVGAEDVAEWIAAGAAGFGFGSELFRTDYSDDDIRTRTRRLVEVLKHANS
ncbi:MAG TPA: 2-dehydro-3-deoxy-6-phosphogalactonate aldolase [Rhizomicrobium sp.]|jgi:2-dehydro-3-deoxyphosphogalactonate aldolase